MLIAAGSPRARTLVAHEANIVTLATSALIARTNLAPMVTDIHATFYEQLAPVVQRCAGH